MRFTILSHAGLVVEHDDVALVVDPWIVGSCYWRSWFNLPEPPKQLVEALRPTHVYLTHLHWDHFHGPSLRRFDRSTQFIVPTFNNDRMIRDLAFLGFENVIEVEHGEAVDLGGLTIQSYQFLNDSAVTISDGDRTILDANDCKMFGLPLEQLLRDHPSIDFVLRSHSNASAYPYCIEDYETLCPELRPRSAYAEEFAAFAKKVGARHAIPFASNHCFLHPETRQFNGLAVKPTEIKRRFDELVAAGEMPSSACVIMAPGSSWSTENGFDLVAFDYDNVDDYIDKLAVRHGETLARQLDNEAEAELDVGAFVRYFERFCNAIPRLARRKLGTFEMRVVEHGVERPFGIDTSTGMVTEGPANDPTFSVRCEALIINDCVHYDMFSVWTPSKRLSVRVRDREAVGAVLTFFALLDGLELEYLPLRKNFDRRMARSSIRRWREPAEAARTLVSTKLFRRPFAPW